MRLDNALFQRWAMDLAAQEGLPPWTARPDETHVGDLLEPGEWVDQAWLDGPAKELGFRSGFGDWTGTLMASYLAAFDDRLGDCSAFLASAVRIGRCGLPCAHASWPGGIEDLFGTAHRIYLFSPRDSAAMLAGMRRRLTEPMEEL